MMLKRNGLFTLPKRSLAILLAVIMSFPLSVLPASAAVCTDRPDAISFSFLNTGNTADISADCYYSDEYFYTPGTILDPHLRTMSLAMAMSAFQSFREEEDYTDRCENFEALMKKAGFTDLEHNSAYDEKPTEDTIGIAVAGKKIDVFGTEYTLLAVGIRGASYESEWANNMRVGVSGQSEGFASAKEQVLDFLSEYETERSIKGHAKIWIAGYSRAGAVANLAAQDLNRDPSAYAVTTEDIYCYTFEAPRGEEVSAAGNCENIHNTVFPADPVPLIPLYEWDLTRAGYVQEGQPDLYSRDDSLLPAPGSTEYENARETMLEHLSKINPDIEYSIDDFKEVRFDKWNADEDDPLSQSEFIQSFTSWLNSTLPDKSRASYAENYQDAFSTLGRIFPSIWSSREEELSAAFSAAVKDPLFYASVAAAVLIIRLRNVMDAAEYEKLVKEASGNISDNLIKHMKEENVGLSDEDCRAFAEALCPVILFADQAIENDISKYGGYHLATLLSNMNTLVQAHSPEVILAWTETFDSYYTPSLATPHQLEHMEREEASCTAAGHREYWKCSVCGTSYADSESSKRTSPEELLIPATGHDWDNGVITEAPTVFSEGVRTFTCRNCGRSRTESVAKLPMSVSNIVDYLFEKQKGLAEGSY